MEKIIIIDSNSVIHRAFHALPPLKNKKGEVVNAVYGYLTFLFKAIRELEPKYIAACFDVSKCTFRKDLYCDYKANRQKAPDELYYQIPLVKNVLKKFNISIFEKEGFEGDDLIGTISKKEIVDLEKIILSGDLDNLQLIDDFTKVFFLGHGINTADIFDEKKVSNYLKQKLLNCLSVLKKEYCPESKSETFPYQHISCTLPKANLVKAETYCKHIPHKREPADQGKRRSPLVYSRFLFFESFRLHFKPLFYPFPFAEIAHSV